MRTAQSSSGQSTGNSPTPSFMRRFVTSPVPMRSLTCAELHRLSALPVCRSALCQESRRACYARLSILATQATTWLTRVPGYRQYIQRLSLRGQCLCMMQQSGSVRVVRRFTPHYARNDGNDCQYHERHLIEWHVSHGRIQE